MRGCAPALTVHIKFFHRPGLPRAVVCISKSKIAQAEYKAKARFQALLRRSRFSRQSLRDRLQLDCDCKSTTQFLAWKAIISYRPTNRPKLLEFVRQTVQLPALSPHESTQKQSDKVLSAQRLTRFWGIRKRPVRVLALHFGYRIIDGGAS